MTEEFLQVNTTSILLFMTNGREVMMEHSPPVDLENSQSHPSFGKLLRAMLFLCLVTLAAYWQVPANDFVIYDDYTYVLENEIVTKGLTLEGIRWALTATHDSNWFPLTWISHMLDVTLFGLDPRGHHSVNLLLHLMNTTLLLLLLSRMTGCLLRSGAVAALFALHPLHVESVAWVSERKDLLSALFFMLTILAYQSYVKKPGPARYVLILLLFALGLSSKPMLVTLPFLLLLLDFWPLRRMPRSNNARVALPGIRPLIMEKLPLLGFSAISCAVTFMVQKRGGSVVDLIDSSPAENLANALLSYFRYIQKTFLPFDLAVFYPFNHGMQLWKPVAALFLLTTITYLVFRFARTLPYLVTGWLWYLGTLVPVIGLIRVGEQSMADRYTYLPLIGLFIMLAWGFADLAAVSKPPRTGIIAAAMVVAGVLGALTWQQTGYWRNSITLFSRALEVTDNNWVAHNNLGAALLRMGDVDGATDHITQSIRINPENPAAHLTLGLIYNNLRNFREAIACFRKVVELKSDHETAHFYLGRGLLLAGDIQGALHEYRVLSELDPLQGARFMKLLPPHVMLRFSESSSYNR